MIRILRNMLMLVVLFVLCGSVGMSYAQQSVPANDPAAQQGQQSTQRDVSDYTDSELVDLYLNDPQNLPEMDDATLDRISQLAHEADQSTN